MKPKKISFRDEAQKAIMSGTEKVYNVAATAYGAKGGNVLLEKTWGDPILSRDGVTNVREVFLEDPLENMGARVLIQASDKNNQTVGDGTSAVVILAYHILKEAQRKVSSGHNPMEVSREIEQAADQIVEQIDAIKKPISPKMLTKVGEISAGDAALGEMIADTISEVGLDGAITVEEYDGLGIYNELVDGFQFNKGFTDVRLINRANQLKAEYRDIPILVLEKRMSSQVELAPIMQKIAEAKIKELLIVGDVSDLALEMLILNKGHAVIDTTVVDTPMFSGNRALFLEDLATVVGAKVVSGNPESFELDHLGHASKATVTEHTTTIIGGSGDKSVIEARLSELRDQLAEAVNPVTIQALRDRMSKLSGKVAVIRVGGATKVEQQERKLRVDDAVCAVQAAIKDGIVPGGGVTLARISGTYIDNALVQPFKQLISNAGENPDWKLGQVLKAKAGYGFNLREMTDDPIDLYKAGIVDPAKVIKEVVINACSVAAKLITTSAAITIIPDGDDK